MSAAADELQQALALARSADARSSEAHRVARDARHFALEAKEESRSAVEGYRSVYQALGELTAEVARLAGGQEELGAWVRRAVHDSLRPPAPSQHDIEEVAQRAATKAAEQTGRHIVVPSDRVRAIARSERHETIAKVAIKVLWILLQIAGGIVIGKLWR